MIVCTSYFGSVDLFEAIALIGRGSVGGGVGGGVGVVSVQAHENFNKQTPRSRCSVMTGGGVRLLSVPTVHRSGSKIPIRSVEIDYTLPWQRNHWRTIVAAYSGSPYWEHFSEPIHSLFEQRERYLFDLNLVIFERLLQILKLDISVTLTDQFSLPTSFSHHFTPYYQVFSEKFPFAGNLSILDAIFCVGMLPSEE